MFGGVSREVLGHGWAGMPGEEATVKVGGELGVSRKGYGRECFGDMQEGA